MALTGPSPSASAASASASANNEYVLNFAFFSFVGFLLVQAVFALIANSESMLADCQAMAVDALTYLFNLCAERIKNRPYTEKELQLPARTRAYKRELQRLYLELVPPTISVATLISVTILTLREAFETLWGENSDEDGDDVSIPIMLLFSFANLMLDVVNVTCFARADSAFGLDAVRREGLGIRESITDGGVGLMKCDPSAHRTTTHPMSSSSSLNDPQEADAATATGEKQKLVVNNDDSSDETHTIYSTMDSGAIELIQGHPHQLVNLNMCSAWTHVCADTMRSTAVLLAAGIATILPSIPSDGADAVAAIAVSVIILVSLIPLIEGLVLTAFQIFALTRQGNQFGGGDDDHEEEDVYDEESRDRPATAM